MELLPTTDWAYLAGLLDGDGCILIRRRDKSKTTGDRQRGISFITIITIGGEVSHLQGLRDKYLVGSVYIRKRIGLRHLAIWTIAGSIAIAVLKQLIPFLSLKLKQAIVALSMPRPRSRWGVTPELRNTQESCRILIQQLNQLGRGKKEKRNGN